MEGARGAISDELNGAGEEAGRSAGSRAGSAFSGALGAAARVGAAAVGAAAAGVSALTTQAVNSYADYEQLTGGIETLYGDAASQMMQYAADAATSTGQSMNEFMDAAIGSSAAMISSLGGDQQRAAELTNQAMIDMADNANKLGTDMEMIQNAYTGFSRGNFTMLDNLALGFSGTREGMEELLAQAQEISGVEYDIDSYADIVESIHVVQTEMGIAGTTMAEANGTIQGSIGQLTASWANLITGLADPSADLTSLIDGVVTNAETALANLTPVITNALGGMAQAIGTLAPVIADSLPGLVQQIVPPLLVAASDIVQALMQGIIAVLPTLAPVAADLVVSFATFIVENLPALISTAIEINLAVVQGITDALPELIPAAVSAVLQICEALTNPDMIFQLAMAAVEICIALGEGLVMAIPNIIEQIPTILSNINEAFAQLGPMLLSGATEWGGDLIDGLVSGISNGISRVQDAVSSVASTIRDFIGFSEPERGPLSNFHTYMPDMFDLLEEGIEDGTPEFEATLNRTLAMPTLGGSAALAGGYGSFGGGSEIMTPVNIFIGQEKLDTILLRSAQNSTYRRGG
jgi:phage-related protein